MISVIIPTCSRNELLSQCLELLKPGMQRIDAKLYEVIVSDDSKEGTAENLIHASYPFAKWVRGPARGPAANRNNGAKYAQGEWLVFIDDDCLPDKDLLNQYSTGIKNNPDCLAFEGAILPDNFDLLKKDLTECPVNTTGGCFWSANICVQKKLFNTLSGFDEQFLIAAQEDQEIQSRILKYTIIPFLNDCIVVHPVRFRKLSEKIKKIPIELNNWLLFADRQKSRYKVFIEGFTSQLKALLKTLNASKYKSSLYHAILIIYLAPGIILYILKHYGNKQKI